MYFSDVPSFNEWRCLRCLSFCRWWKTEKHSCRSIVICISSYPPQYPHSSTPGNHPPPSFFLSFSSPSFSLIFLFFPPFYFTLFFLSFHFSFLSSFPDPPLFLVFSCSHMQGASKNFWSHMWISQITQINEYFHAHGWVMSHKWCCARSWFPGHTYEWVMSCIWISNVTYEWMKIAFTITHKEIM